MTGLILNLGASTVLNAARGAVRSVGAPNGNSLFGINPIGVAKLVQELTRMGVLLGRGMANAAMTPNKITAPLPQAALVPRSTAAPAPGFTPAAPGPT